MYSFFKKNREEFPEGIFHYVRSHNSGCKYSAKLFALTVHFMKKDLLCTQITPIDANYQKSEIIMLLFSDQQAMQTYETTN